MACVLALLLLVYLQKTQRGVDKMAAELDHLKTLIETFVTRIPALEQKVSALIAKPPLINPTELTDLSSKLVPAIQAAENIINLIEQALAPPPAPPAA